MAGWKKEEELELILKQARSSLAETRKVFVQREKEIQEAKKKRMIEKKADEERKEETRIRNEMKITKDIWIYGLWQTAEEVNANLLNLKNDDERKLALKAQFRYRTVVLKQKSKEKGLLVMGQKSWRGLAVNLRKAIAECATETGSELRGNVGARLVGKFFKHQIGDENNGRMKIFFCISQVPGFPAYFNIKYKRTDKIYVKKIYEEYLSQRSIEINEEEYLSGD